MIYIKNFVYDFDFLIIIFEVECDGIMNYVGIRDIGYGMIFIDINDFIEDWLDFEYD